ncbi:hypothetical protein ABZS88_41775 [Streptomyces sp. NPDC005480]|uniref:hypothetical protein n=1 Tax=Streptomyces sp. NPDC005480 TaxID=3154880 RepID=UPI0033B60E8B
MPSCNTEPLSATGDRRPATGDRRPATGDRPGVTMLARLVASAREAANQRL